MATRKKKKNVATPSRVAGAVAKKGAKTVQRARLGAGTLPPMKTAFGAVMPPASVATNIELHARNLTVLASMFEADAVLDSVAHGPSADPWFRAAAAVLQALVLGRRYKLPRDMQKLEALSMRLIQRVRESKKNEPRFALDAPRTVAEEELRDYTLGRLQVTRDARALVASFIADLDLLIDVASSILIELPTDFANPVHVDAAVVQVEALLRNASRNGEEDGLLAEKIVRGTLEALGYRKYKSLFDAKRKAEKKLTGPVR